MNDTKNESSCARSMRSIRLDLSTPVEAALRTALGFIEGMPPHDDLTKAVVAVGDALELVGRFQDAKLREALGVADQPSEKIEGDNVEATIKAIEDQIERVETQVLPNYREIGPAGSFGEAMISISLDNARAKIEDLKTRDWGRSTLEELRAIG